MGKLRKYLFVCLAILAMLLMHPGRPVLAADGAGFTMQVVDHPKQYRPDVTYFDLLVKPSEQGQLSVRLRNQTAKQIKVELAVHSGYTNEAGYEMYDLAKLGKRSTAPFQLSQIFGGSQVVELAGNADKVVSFAYQMPDQAFTGILEGAVYAKSLAKSERQETNQRGFYLHQKYALALGLVLREDVKTKVRPELKMGKISTAVDSTASFSPAVTANLANVQPQILTALTIKGQVLDQQGQKLYQTKKTGLGMAPSSNFNFHIATDNQRLQAGKYRLRIVATSHDQKWTFEQPFTITRAQAAKGNESLDANKRNKWGLRIGLSLLVLLILYLIYRWGRRQGRKQQQPVSKDQS
ncbi:DUF916 and DUF3324 domain-containing protein [Lapidilactobacillus achengensis]|uniref:DUF916 and DUF3324 domain-containing protein n=1 Tax=Lapidilactobacillus achengensis TaxID=2486000 RepID=A0ABW1UNY0_9LACO|nr:DUF916 and DUF3324 domain-containing protein [Lapidilactobacillus achengensis]